MVDLGIRIWFGSLSPHDLALGTKESIIDVLFLAVFCCLPVLMCFPSLLAPVIAMILIIV